MAVEPKKTNARSPKGNIQVILGYDGAKLLSGIASWFYRVENHIIALRMLTKAEEIALKSDNALNLHFIYHSMIKVYYRRREIDQTALNDAISACEKQIALSARAREAFKQHSPGRPLSRHLGYQQLAIIREKQQNYVEAIRLSRSAMSEGWSGDWENRITRCERKLNKSDAPKKKNKSKNLFHEFKK